MSTRFEYFSVRVCGYVVPYEALPLINSSSHYYLFLPATRFGPLRVRALVLVL